MRGALSAFIIGGVINFTPPVPKYTYVPPSLEQKAENEARINKIDPIWYKAICKTESAWNAKATSYKKAKSIAQLMPETIKKLGIVNEYDGFESIQGGARWAYLGAIELGFNPDDNQLTEKQYEKLSRWYNCGGPNLKKNPRCGDPYWREVKKNMDFYKKRRS